jgi:ABC-2 type transport system permease protein
MRLLKILAIARIYSSWFLSSKLWLVNQLIIPFAMYIIFSIVVGKGFEIYALVGAIVALPWNAGANATSQQLFAYKHYYRIKDMFVVSALHPLEFALGCGLGALLNAILPVIPIFILMGIYVGILSIFSVAIFLSSWLLGTLFGFWLGNFARDPVKLSSVTNLLYYLLTILPPVYYPVSLLPQWASYLALLIPTTSLSHILSYLIHLNQNPFHTIPFTILTVYAFVFTLMALRYSKWRED